MTEKRQVSRQRSFLHGLVYFGNAPSGTECLVCDLSETGARLKFSGPVTSTDTLKLHIPIKGQTFRANVKWYTADEIGIAFISDTAVIADHPSDNEAEIRALRQLTKRLQNKVNMPTGVA